MKEPHRYRFSAAGIIVLVLVTCGCEGVQAGDTELQTGRLGPLPASFEGELPCTDCPGIHYRLDLFEDKVFFLRMTYLGRGTGAVSDSLGTWQLAGDTDRLTLFGVEEAPLLFRVVNRDTLRKLDTEGLEIESSLDYDLRRKEGLPPIEIRMTMRGMYSYYADAALFEECLSGRRFRVAMEADNLALERAYLEARHEPGEKIFVTLQGRIAERPAMEGDTMVLTVVPERLLDIWPGETCGTMAWAPAAALDTIRVTVTFDGKFELPEHAVLEIHLREVFNPDRPTAEVATIVKRDPGSPPYILEIPVEPRAIDPRYTYAVRAWITVDDELWYNSIRSYPVFTKGAGTEVEIPLIRVGPPAGPALHGLPATFTGTLPCPDCEGVRYHLDLLDRKQIFYLRRIHGRGEDEDVVDTIGKWGTTLDHTGWVLWQGTAEPLAMFRYAEGDVLRMLDLQSRELEPIGTFDLRRTGFKPIEPKLEMRGMYGITGGSAFFVECLTEQTHVVASEGDSQALKSAFLERHPEPGQKLLATLDGRLVNRSAEGHGTVPLLVVDRFLGLSSGETCDSHDQEKQAPPRAVQ